MQIQEVGEVYFSLISKLELDWLRDSIQELPVQTYWQERARVALLNQLYEQIRELTANVLHADKSKKGARRFQVWHESKAEALARYRAIFSDLRSGGQPDLSMLSVALGETRRLI